jgi:Mg/Co/Ni transporter MgtE
MQKNCLIELERSYAISMLNTLPSDDAADFFGLLPNKEADFLLNQMEKKEASDIKQLLTYQVETAGSLMTTEYVTVAQYESVEAVIKHLRNVAADSETIYYLYVTNEKQQLLGVVSLRELFIASPESLIKDIMATQFVSVAVDTNRMEIVQIIKKYGFLAVPVVKSDYILAGIVTFDDILSYL